MVKWTTVESYDEVLGNGNDFIRVISKYQGNEGSFSIFAETLSRSTSCTHFDLSSNKIGPEGAKEIADSLKINTSLTSLE
mmetsp:Transcript_5479/g.7241  ORF Transcript_5479/g.7241 Transcript_5479/m.7241 type:complete len:80 (+) Transcript_5479:604-843(+)